LVVESGIVVLLSHASLISVLWLLSLHVDDQLLDQLEDFWFVDQINIELTWVLFLIILVVSFVSNFFLLYFSKFFDLVMVDVQLLSIEGLLVKVDLGLSSMVWVSEAYEGIDSFSFLRE